MHYSVARDFSYAAEEYERYAGLQYGVVEKAAKRLRGMLSPSDRILDVGCGTGYLRAHVTNPLFGCDLARGMCMEAPFPACCADAACLPFADAAVEAVFSSLALQWVEEKPLALAEMQRVCKPGGVAVITTLGPKTLYELREQDIPTLEFMDAQTYQIFAQQAGWQVEKCDTELEVREYNTLLELLRNIKAIGARHKSRRGYLRKSELLQPACGTWEIITLQLRKTAA